MGEQVGAGNASLAKKHAITHIVWSVGVMLIIMACLRIFDDTVAGMFTENEEDQGYIKEVLNVLSVYLIGDAIHGVITVREKTKTENIAGKVNFLAIR